MRQINLFIILIIACMTESHAHSLQFADIDSALCKIWESDQDLRNDLIEEMQKQPQDVMAILSLKLKMDAIDAENQKYVSNLLDRNGWNDEFSSKAHDAIFLVIDHADKEFSEKYFPQVKEKAAKGVISPSKAATLEDRILMKSNKKQKYGTQTIQKKDSEGNDMVYIWPVEDAENVDELRTSVNLPLMSEYIQLLKNTLNREIIWDKTGKIDGFYHYP
ncbi:MAG: hypothetical protein LBG28_03500 [Tannerella sp.]|nr:hypothetical protein [Tannerella sp.]